MPYYHRISKQIVFWSVLLVPLPSFADSHRNFSMGVTQTNNLENPFNAKTAQNTKVKRIGISSNLSLLKQSLDYSGGYTLEAQFNINKSLDNTGDIHRIHLAVSHLFGLNNDWLMRSRVQLHYLDHQAVAINSYTALQVENTLGYVQNDNSGTDIALKLRVESHDKVADEQYKTHNISIALSHYFPHKKQSAYWAGHTSLSNYNANDPQRDFKRLSAGIEYRQWHLGKFTGVAGMQWQYDQYNKRQARSLFSPSLQKNIPSTFIQKDRYVFAEINVNRPLKKSLDLQFSASIGRYQSSQPARHENFYRLASHINWNF